MLIVDNVITFSVCTHDTSFCLGDIIKSNHQCEVFKFDTYIEQCMDMHRRFRDIKADFHIYTFHEILGISRVKTVTIPCSFDSPFLVDCSTIGYAYLMSESLYDSKMAKFCYDYSFCDDL